MSLPPEVVSHDKFNIVALSVIAIVDVIYLYNSSQIDLIGMDTIGSEHRHLSDFLLVTFSLYLIVDLLWVILIPKCVASSPGAIILHHVVCLVLLSIPWHLRQFSWHLAVNLLAEWNTIFLTVRRNVQMGSFAYRCSDVLFYLTWLVLRLAMFPAMTIFLFFEYVRYSTSVGTYSNIMACAPVLQFVITGMSFKWTFDLLVKLQRRKKE